MAEKDNTLDWTGTDKSDHLLTPEAELIPEGRAQGSRLPTSVQHDFIDATPSGEVQEPINGGAASGDGTAAGSVTRECTVNQQVSHGRGDKFSGYFADSSVQDRFGDQRFSHQRENFSSPVFTKGQVPMDVEGASILQGISQGPQWTNAMPSGGMRVNPWKVRTGPSWKYGRRVSKASRIVSGYEDVLGYRDNQGFSQGSNVTNNRYENNLRTHPLINFAHNSNSAYARGNKKAAATYDGLGSWQDYIVHFEMIAEINGWDENTKALELATCLRGSAQAILSDLRRRYAHLVAALTSRFQPSNQAELYRAQMKGKSRNKDQPLPELAKDIKRVTR
ncbi:unnamed protein product [Mytilus edulis]|uniref:Uncharacterized protein n=1 Tax=Mytilus edulis TaxID=6550 RepID=A0A8S3QH92_MYTED|nr:unnamed protein product [Mytilus edulis]